MLTLDTLDPSLDTFNTYIVHVLTIPFTSATLKQLIFIKLFYYTIYVGLFFVSLPLSSSDSICNGYLFDQNVVIIIADNE